MTRFMLDALNVHNIPRQVPTTTLLASYVDHPEYAVQPFDVLCELFPNHRCVPIAAHGGDALICDVENGAMTPADVPTWLVRQRLRGGNPWCYATESNWYLVHVACISYGIAPPLWWKADWADGPDIPASAIGTQYAHNGLWDTSVILDYIPGFDPPPITPRKVTDMSFRVVQKPGSPAEVAFYSTAAVGMASSAQTAIFLANPDCLSTTVETVDEAQWGQLWRSIETYSPSPGGIPTIMVKGMEPAQL